MKNFFLSLASLPLVIGASSQSWTITGNGNINPANHFLGTTNNNPLKFRVNNRHAGEIDSVNGKTFLGYGAGQGSTVAGNTAVGYFALTANTTGEFNTGLGYYALTSNTTATYNTAVGNRALFATTTGSDNTATGYRALYYNTTGFGNTSTGSFALYRNTTGHRNTATGFYSLNYNTTGTFNSAHGVYSLAFNNTGSYNTAAGYGALYKNSNGQGNCAVGTTALGENTTGDDNSAVGRDALASNTTGSFNTAVGYSSLFFTKNSSNNTSVGSLAGYYNSGTAGFGSNNTMLGAQSTGSFSGQYNFTAIGYAAIAPDNNTVRIGGSTIWSIGGYAGWTNFSDGRFKRNVSENVKGLEFIMKLRPVTYTLDIMGAGKHAGENSGMEWEGKMKEAVAEKEAALYTGFIAQEVEQAAKEAGYDFSGVDKPRTNEGVYGLRYAEFVVPLVKAMQEQQGLIEELRKQNAGLQARIEALEKKQGSNKLIPADAAGSLSVWPNPSRHQILVELIAESKSQATIAIFDNKGSLIKQQHVSLREGKNLSFLDIKALAKGAYHVTAEWGDGSIKKATTLIKE